MKYSRAFTIVELIVVIVVIGILAAITIVSYDTIETRAKATALGDGLRKVDKSLQTWVTFSNFTTWPIDPVGDGGIALRDLAASDPILNDVLSDIPEVEDIHTEDWFYDNEGDSKDNCTMPYDGVNIVIRFVKDANVAEQLDKNIDDGDINCGQIRYVDERIFYSLSNDQSID